MTADVKNCENVELLLISVRKALMATQNKALAMQIETDLHDFITIIVCSINGVCYVYKSCKRCFPNMFVTEFCTKMETVHPVELSQ